MEPHQPQPKWVCRYCDKEHNAKFIRCLRCGRLRLDINIDAILAKLLIGGGIVVIFIALLMLSKSLYSESSDTVFQSQSRNLETKAFTLIYCAIAACIAGLFFHLRMKRKKNELLDKF